MQSLTLPQLQSNHNHLLQHSPTYSSSNVIVSSNHYLPKLTASSSSSSTSFSPSKPPTSSATSSVESVQINGNGKYKLQVAVEGGCDHFAQIVNADLVEQKWKDKFSLLCRWSLKLQQRSTGHYTDGSKRRKIEMPACEGCGNSIARPLVCMTCGVVCCGESEGGRLNHSQQHRDKSKHHLYFDLRSATIWCASCEDYIYHPMVENLIELEGVRFEGAKLSSARSKVIYEPWKASTKAVPNFDRIEHDFQPRGLRNLGQTCFMSCVLQSFLHNPLLRAYFLSDRHHRDLCISTEGVEGGSSKSCLGCEMDHLFTEFCSNDTTVPFGPTSFLHTMWQCSSELSGYAQQDAHEFLISALNLIHAATPGSSEDRCKCVVHSTFAGQLRSDVRCGQCNNVTQSLDPMLDLSLELRKGGGEINTLGGCLKRFTSPELLAPGQYVCAACGESQKTASKQLSIKKLPPVLCIQLKRFEHATGSQKIDSPVRFPLKLNMREYTSNAIADSSSRVGPDSLYDYDLISVINHEGSLSQGHYTTYCREVDDFFCFDDDKVRRATLPEVLNSKAYILVYLKKTLDYATA